MEPDTGHGLEGLAGSVCGRKRCGEKMLDLVTFIIFGQPPRDESAQGRTPEGDRLRPGDTSRYASGPYLGLSDDALGGAATGPAADLPWQDASPRRRRSSQGGGFV